MFHQENQMKNIRFHKSSLIRIHSSRGTQQKWHTDSVNWRNCTASQPTVCRRMPKRLLTTSLRTVWRIHSAAFVDKYSLLAHVSSDAEFRMPDFHEYFIFYSCLNFSIRRGVLRQGMGRCWIRSFATQKSSRFCQWCLNYKKENCMCRGCLAPLETV